MTPVVTPFCSPGLVPHQKTPAPAPIRSPHADILGDAKREEEEWPRGDACVLGLWFGRCWRMAGEAMLEGSGGLVELFVRCWRMVAWLGGCCSGGVVGGGDLVVASCLVQNNESNRKTAI